VRFDPTIPVFEQEKIVHAWPPRSPDLTVLDFLLWGYMQSLVYETQRDLVARIAIAAGTIREMSGMFQRVHNIITRWCRTCSEVGGRHFEQVLTEKQRYHPLKLMHPL
jgi:hypothetical protein